MIQFKVKEKIEFKNIRKKPKNTFIDPIKRDTEFESHFKFNLIEISILNNLDFFEIFSKSNMKILPIISIDMSENNIYDEDSKSSFHDKRGENPSIYSWIIEKFTKSIRFFSTEYAFPYAFGCKEELDDDISNCYALSFNYFSPLVMTKKLLK